jgi:hypothetical protein
MAIAWALYAALLGFVLGGSFVWGTLEPPHSLAQQQRTAEEHQRPDSHAKEKTEEALARYTLWLTICTGVLAFATIALGIATAGLYLTGEKQIEIARANTDALINSERAHLFIGIKSETVAKIVGMAGGWDHSPSMWEAKTDAPGVGYFFINHGRTAAILKEIGERMIVANTFPDVYHIDLRETPNELVIAPDKESTVLLCYKKNFTIGDAVAFQQGKTAIWFFGFVRFADAFGQETTWRWRYCYRSGYGGFRLVWYEEAPPKKRED